MVLAFRACQADLNSAFAVSMSLDEPIGSPPVRWMATSPEPDAGHAFGGQTDPADALLAFEHDVVANADCAELQHLAGFARAVPETYKTPLQPNMLAGRRWFTH